jgi:hypothetical protein
MVTGNCLKKLRHVVRDTHVCDSTQTLTPTAFANVKGL